MSTPELSSQSSKRRQREQAEAPITTPAAKTPAPVSLETVLGQGGKVKLGDKTYELAPFPLGRLREAQDLLTKWPEILYFAGFLAAGEGDDILNAAEVAKMMTLVRIGQDALEGEGDCVAEPVTFTADDIYRNAAHLTSLIDDDTINAIADLVALALRRKHADISRADVIDHIDIPTAVTLLRAIFAQNLGLKGRLNPPTA